MALNAAAPPAIAASAQTFYGTRRGGTLEDLAYGTGGGSAFDLGKRAFGDK